MTADTRTRLFANGAEFDHRYASVPVISYYPQVVVILFPTEYNNTIQCACLT